MKRRTLLLVTLLLSVPACPLAVSAGPWGPPRVYQPDYRRHLPVAQYPT
jgi:hypothetical protein